MSADQELVRKLREDGATGQYFWQPGLQLGQPDMLLGRPVAETLCRQLSERAPIGADDSDLELVRHDFLRNRSPFQTVSRTASVLTAGALLAPRISRPGRAPVASPSR